MEGRKRGGVDGRMNGRKKEGWRCEGLVESGQLVRLFETALPLLSSLLSRRSRRSRMLQRTNQRTNGTNQRRRRRPRRRRRRRRRLVHGEREREREGERKAEDEQWRRWVVDFLRSTYNEATAEETGEREVHGHPTS